MNLPFKFASMNNSTQIMGLLFNPWGASLPANTINNSVLTNLDAGLQQKYGLLMPAAAVWITGFAVAGDTTAAPFSLGVWDVNRATFDELYPCVALTTQGAGYLRRFAGSGLWLPLSSTLLPVLKYTGASTCTFTGDLDLIVPQNDTKFGSTVAAQPSESLIVTDDALGMITDDATPPQPLTADS